MEYLVLVYFKDLINSLQNYLPFQFTYRNCFTNNQNTTVKKNKYNEFLCIFANSFAIIITKFPKII